MCYDRAFVVIVMRVLGSRKGNKIVIDGDIARIIIVSKRYGHIETSIDSADVELAAGYTWAIRGQARKDRIELRAFTNVRQPDSSYKMQQLHHLIAGKPPTGFMIDHIDGDPLNNRRSNLRHVTAQQNTCNQVRAKGIYFHKDAGRWQASIKCDGINRFLGYFADRAEGEAAYQKAKAERDARVFNVIDPGA